MGGVPGMDIVSLPYAIFLSVAVIVYWFCPSGWRWLWLLGLSVLFYVLNAALYLVIPLGIGFVSYASGLWMARTANPLLRKIIFIGTLAANIGVLLFFKYAVFLAESLRGVFNFIQAHVFFQAGASTAPWSAWHLVVPLGISYVTFQAMGYVIEVYRGTHSPEKNAGYFISYIMFFPKLFAGPIERAHHFLPQMRQSSPFNVQMLRDGTKQIGWGLFKKLVVAQQISLITSPVFSRPDGYAGFPVALAALLFMVQLYADFSGYTDIALGSARLFGLDLIRNFDFPLIARSTAELWRRWHISLSTWFFDYVYNPLAIVTRNWGQWAVVFASMVTFLVLGLWHGASWQFLILGGLQGAALSLEFLTKKWRKRLTSRWPEWLNNAVGLVMTLSFFSFALIFLRANRGEDALVMVRNLFVLDGVKNRLWTFSSAIDPGVFTRALLLIGFLLLVEYADRNFLCQGRGVFRRLVFLCRQNWVLRTAIYAVMAYLVAGFGLMKPEQFIYFQF